MAGFTSIASTAMQVFSTASALAKTFDSYQDRSGIDQYERNRLALDGLSQKTALQKEQNRLDQLDKDRERQDRLRAALARQRASFGASGTGSSSGSAQASLLRLIEGSETEGRAQNEATTIQNRILDQEFANRQAINMLEATQMKQKKKIGGVTAAYNALSSIF